MRYWFTADEHYGHRGILKHQRRPFTSVEKMDEAIAKAHNLLVAKDDVVVHAGDFCWKQQDKDKYLKRLVGTHVVLRGSHGPKGKDIWVKKIEGQLVVVCHYAMRTWPCSHYNSWQLYGHSHGRLYSTGQQMDVGVDTNPLFLPYPFEIIRLRMASRPDNPNLVQKELDYEQKQS